MDTVRRYSMFIDGDWVDADERFEIRSPATEELVASVAKGGLDHADRAVAAARAAHADGRWRRTPPAERAAVLDAIAARLTERIDELAVLEALENGAPVRQAGAFQIGFSIAHLHYFAGQARSYAFERPGPLLRVPRWPAASSAASRWACARPSCPGTSRCCWPCGRSARRWPRATRSWSSPTSTPRSRCWSSP